MAITGLDVEVVDQKGRELKNLANEVGNLLSRIDQLVQGLPSVWVGPDADEFVNNLWPTHKRTLQAAQTDIDALGTRAIQNAEEQRDVANR